MAIELTADDFKDALARRASLSAKKPRITTFAEQRACIDDPSKLKVEFCTRRAAKTFTFGVECIEDSYDWAGAKYLFLGMTRPEAERIFWLDVLKALNSEYQLGMRFNESKLVATMPNGAQILIGAADANAEEMRKLLGQKYRKVGIDEAQDWIHTDLHELIYETLKPAMVDLRGSITLMGTPGHFLKSFFRKVTPVSVRAGMAGAKPEFPGWSVHCWDTSCNTSVVAGERMCDKWAEEIAEMVATHPGIEQTPAFRRHRLGEWVVEEDKLVYRYLTGRNDFDGVLPKFPKGKWTYVLGIDLGYEDATAFVLCAYHDFSKCLYILEVFRKSGMDLTDVANKVKEYGKRFDIAVNVIDGANKQGVMEMVNRHEVALTAADKTGKADFIELMNADMIMGRVKVNPAMCRPLIDEWAGLVWNDKSANREEHPACENHACDGALYAWRHCYPYVSRDLPAEQPKSGTAEWAAQQVAEMERADLESQRRQTDRNQMYGDDDMNRHYQDDSLRRYAD